MLTFTPVTQRDIARLRRYYKSCEYQLCEYSALVKLMWRGHLHPCHVANAGFGAAPQGVRNDRREAQGEARRARPQAAATA